MIYFVLILTGVVAILGLLTLATGVSVASMIASDKKDIKEGFNSTDDYIQVGEDIY